MKRRTAFTLNIITASFLSLMVGCDPMYYTIRGKVLGLGDPLGGTPRVEVAYECPGVLRLSNHTTSENDGSYQLKGTGIPEGCTLKFQSPNVREKTIVVTGEHFKEGGGFDLIYEVNAEMEME